MNAYMIVAIVLIVFGLAGLIYGKFNYTTETHNAKLGPIELSVSEKETVNVPVWLGAGAVVLGAAMLLCMAMKH